jgi:hypothetical protein
MDAPVHAALVDAHVHFHGCFDPDVFLASARANFRAAALELGLDPAFSAHLLLTESAGADWFNELGKAAAEGSPPADGWAAKVTDDARELKLVYEDGATLNVVAGRQIVTAEGIEVLALGMVAAIPDGYPIAETLRHVSRVEAIPVIPWGFGKWLGRRGDVVRELVERATPTALFLGDNSGRLSGTAEPPLFSVARHKGIGILPGTDPFPFREQARRVGRMGFTVTGTDQLADWRRLREAILAQRDLKPYGSLERPLAFVGNQVAMQLRKRLASRGSRH